MSYGPGQAMGEVMESVTKGIFPWDQGDYRSAGKMSDYAMQGMAAGAAVIIAVAIIITVFVISVYVRRAWGKATTVAKTLWWTLAITLTCWTMATIMIDSRVQEGWYLLAWSFFGFCVTVTGCELYSMQNDHKVEIADEDLDSYITSFAA